MTHSGASHIEDTNPNKSLGQHWLHDQSVLSDIASAAQCMDGDFVLEIGPGLGTLTVELLARGAFVTALEYDAALAADLRQRITAKYPTVSVSQLHVVEGDIRTFDLGTLPIDYKICANIPYYLTSYLIRMLCDTQNKPAIAALLMQKEVAQRIVSPDGRRGLISCIVDIEYETSLGREVGAELFTPPPKVDSQVLILNRRPTPLFVGDQKRIVYRVLKAGFSAKRKNLRNSLAGGLGLEKQIVEAMAEKAGIDLGRRAETLGMHEWGVLADALDPYVK